MRIVNRAFSAVSVSVVALLVGCASNAASEDSSSSSADEISASDIMSRANDYLTHDIVYCGGPRGGEDETGCGEGICDQPIGPWDDYRSDCSGFVSYVWQIPSDPDTATYSYDQSGTQGWSTISIDDLRAGDAVVAEGHIKLFSEFSGTNAALIYEEYDCNKIAHKEVQAFSRSGNQIWFDGDDRAYHAIRRNALTPPGPTPPKPTPKPGPPTPTPVAPKNCGVITPGEGLASGKALRSCDDRFELVMQGDGNLVEYGPAGSMWSSKTSGTDGHAAIMQGDGNFVVYGKTSDALWDSGTNGHDGAFLQLQNDGNVVVYASNKKPIWDTATEFPAAPAKPTACGAIKPGHGLAAGETLKSCDGKFVLSMQTDGNLVVYEGTRALWSSKTENEHAYDAILQGDGNFVVYDWKGKALWSSGTAGRPASSVDMQTDGNLVLYGANGKANWASNTEQ